MTLMSKYYKDGEKRYMHYCKDGTGLFLEDMTETHLENTIMRIIKLSESGIIIQHSVNEWGEEYDDSEHLYGNEVKEYMGWSNYIEERHRRNLIKELKQ